MILSQPDLRAAVESGEVEFDPPLEEEQWGEASVDLRLGFNFTQLKGVKGLTVSVAQGLGTIGDVNLWATMELKREDKFGKLEKFILEPKEFVLALTYESIKVPTNMIALIEGRSTYARVGLSMHQTAPWIQPGWSGPVVLEMMNHGPLNIALTPMIDKPCQLTFFELKTEVPPEIAYGARPSDMYQDQKHPLVHKRDRD